MILILCSFVSAIDYETISIRINDDNTTTPRITYYSDERGYNITQNFEGVQKFDKCKATVKDEYWVIKESGRYLNFNCSTYSDYDDYLQKKMQENIDYRKSPPSLQETDNTVCDHTTINLQLADALARITILELMLNITEEIEIVNSYMCEAEGNKVRECPLGLSIPDKDTKLVENCYTGFTLLGYKYYDKCSSGWILQ